MSQAYAGKTPAPEFPQGLDWLNTDRPLSMKDLRGKIVLLDFWTYCCINCMHVIPELKKLEARYPKELIVIGVHSAKFATEQGTANIRQAILRYGLTHPVINDKDLAVWNTYGIDAWPTFVFIDPEGKIVARHSGENVYDLFDRFIAGMIAEFDAKGLIDRHPLKIALERERAKPTPLMFPGKLALDASHHRLFVSDSNHNRIVAVNLNDGVVSQIIGQGREGLKDGTFTDAEFFHPQGLALDGSTLYVADTENHAIRQVDLTQGHVSTLAGTGQQAQAVSAGGRGPETALNSPWDLLVRDGKLYIAMAGSHQLWTLDLKSQTLAPFAGSGLENILDGPLKSAALAQPSGITHDEKHLFFADSEVSAVRQADLHDDGQVKTLVGQGLFDFGDRDGALNQARLQHPLGVLYHQGVIYVADTYNHKIKRIDLAARRIETLAGTGKPGYQDGPALQAQLNEPSGLACFNNKLYIADTNNHQIRVLDLQTATLGTLAVAEAESFRGQVITLPAQHVLAGEGTIDVSVAVPPGFKQNRAAPFFIGVRATDAQVAAVPAMFASRNITNPTFPLRVPVKFAPGKTTVTVDLVVYYCQNGQESECQARQVRVVMPLEAGSIGTTSATAEVRL